jgi:hypothetical protein
MITAVMMGRLTIKTADKHGHIFPRYINASPCTFFPHPPPPLYLLQPKDDSKTPFSSARHATLMLAIVVNTVAQGTRPSLEI